MHFLDFHIVLLTDFEDEKTNLRNKNNHITFNPKPIRDPIWMSNRLEQMSRHLSRTPSDASAPQSRSRQLAG